MTTWKPGNTVTFNPKRATLRDHTGSFEVEEVYPIPVGLIKYNPNTEEGGVGHHQHIKLKGRDNLYSGYWFDSD